MNTAEKATDVGERRRQRAWEGYLAGWGRKDIGAVGGALLRPVAAAEHGHEMRTIHQAIQESFGEHGIGKERIELFGVAIGGHNQRAVWVAPTDTISAWVLVVCGGVGARSGSAWWSGSARDGAAGRRSGRTGRPPTPRSSRNPG